MGRNKSKPKSSYCFWWGKPCWEELSRTSFSLIDRWGWDLGRGGNLMGWRSVLLQNTACLSRCSTEPQLNPHGIHLGRSPGTWPAVRDLFTSCLALAASPWRKNAQTLRMSFLRASPLSSLPITVQQICFKKNNIFDWRFFINSFLLPTFF